MDSGADIPFTLMESSPLPFPIALDRVVFPEGGQWAIYSLPDMAEVSRMPQPAFGSLGSTWLSPSPSGGYLRIENDGELVEYDASLSELSRIPLSPPAGGRAVHLVCPF